MGKYQVGNPLKGNYQGEIVVRMLIGGQLSISNYEASSGRQMTNGVRIWWAIVEVTNILVEESWWAIVE